MGRGHGVAAIQYLSESLYARTVKWDQPEHIIVFLARIKESFSARDYGDELLAEILLLTKEVGDANVSIAAWHSLS